MRDVTGYTSAHVRALAAEWYEKFNRLAGDLYPGRYTHEFVQELAELAFEIWTLSWQKRSIILAHSYEFPELHEVAAFVSDSLRLAQEAERLRPERIDYSSVHFMAETAKCILGELTRVFVQGDPKIHSCSLVLGTDHKWVRRWKDRNPDGVLCTYVNSDIELKAMSHYITTSSNCAEVIARAHRENPNAQILVLPDKFLAAVMKAKAHVKYGVPRERVEIYKEAYGVNLSGPNAACCYVHEKIGDSAPEEAFLKYGDDAELLLHPECGCASSCLLKLDQGILPRDRVYYESTEGMLRRVRESQAKTFVIGTELGMIYRLRQMCPDRTFVPISPEAVCGYMKQNNLTKLRDSLLHDRFEIVLDDNVPVSNNSVDGNVIRVNRAAAEQARVAIQRMLSTPAA